MSENSPMRKQQRFQIVEIAPDFSHAGTKATADVAAIAERLGFQRISVRMDTEKIGLGGKLQRQMGFLRDWAKAKKEIPAGSIVLLQEPFHYPQVTREKTLQGLKAKGVRFIAMVHDVEALRKFRDNAYYKREFQTMLELSDRLIVHNEAMEAYFIKTGVPKAHLFQLGIFDYLYSEAAQKALRMPSFDRSLTIAGNLDPEKSGYISHLSEIPAVSFHLFGPNFRPFSKNVQNIRYGGIFSGDEIPTVLTEGFGLIWDGDSMETCSGDAGEYLRFNSPHKLSLYLSAGLPVILWEEAAAASLIRSSGAGLTIASLKELPKKLQEIKITDYEAMAEKAKSLGERLRAGFYTERIVAKCLESLF